MTTREDNELLTQVGPGTPMGTMMRQYWIPACLSSELKADGDPLRLVLLGERLVAFRDTAGRVGLFDHRCPHRCASLFFGRNEAGGLRCIYHGWKFDTDGNCLDMPNLPPDQDFRDKVKARSYRTAERNGVVFAYLGERQAAPPPLPMLEAMLSVADELSVSCRQRECNWLQALEGDLDTSHFSFLHVGKIAAEDVPPDHLERFQFTDRAPRFHLKRTDWGAMYAAYRPAEPGYTYYRYGHFAMPFWALFPNGPLADCILAQGWVPMDDTHTMTFTFAWTRKTPVIGTLKDGSGFPFLDRLVPILPNTADWYGRFRPVPNQSNDYLIDREAQRTVSYTGINGVFPQDSAVTEGMGAISDRTLETLAPSDMMIVITRRRLIEAARALRDNGVVPPLVDDPETAFQARAGDLIAPEGQDWLDAYSNELRHATHSAMPQAAE